jgi:hypothetical protein
MSSRPFPPSAALCSPCRIVLNEIEYVERIRERIVLRDREKLVGWLSSQQPAASKQTRSAGIRVGGGPSTGRARTCDGAYITDSGYEYEYNGWKYMDSDALSATPAPTVAVGSMASSSSWPSALFFIRSLFCLYSLAVGCVHCCRPDHRRTESSYLKQCGRRACQ